MSINGANLAILARVLRILQRKYQKTGFNFTFLLVIWASLVLLHEAFEFFFPIEDPNFAVTPLIMSDTIADSASLVVMGYLVSR